MDNLLVCHVVQCCEKEEENRHCITSATAAAALRAWPWSQVLLFSLAVNKSVATHFSRTPTLLCQMLNEIYSGTSSSISITLTVNWLFHVTFNGKKVAMAFVVPLTVHRERGRRKQLHGRNVRFLVTPGCCKQPWRFCFQEFRNLISYSSALGGWEQRRYSSNRVV
jgi:hypothetical protein